jgi:uncharacterized protein YbbC (DUF1343 family)
VEDRPNIESTTDSKTDIRIWSLYGSTNRPTPAMLAGIDTLVFDIQDVGVRFYTYESTMLYAMEEAAKAKIPFIVLDRPDPITGTHVEGPMLDKDQLSFVGAYPLPLRHGMTIGELARLENSELGLGADLQVIQMTGWKRNLWFDFTALPWVAPSPNIRNLNEATLYPALAMLEYSTNYSVGRGTAAPFEQIGADWIDGTALAAEMNARAIPGVRFHPVQFTPSSSNFHGKTVEGIGFELTDRDRFSAPTLGAELALALGKLYPGKMKWEASLRLIGSRATMAAFAASASENDTMAATQAGVPEFLKLRAKYLLYQ